MARDPFAVLGVGPNATLDEVRAARRRLARHVHPDHGGDETRMREINLAFEQAVKAILHPAAEASSLAAAVAATPPDPAPAAPGPRRRWAMHVQYDAPSFTVDVLPVEAFEALLAVTPRLGDVLVDDPPYLLEVRITEPRCWCRLELVPEAGGTTVSLTVAGRVDIEAVRDLWIAALNGSLNG
jgi:hypothetical protein